MWITGCRGIDYTILVLCVVLVGTRGWSLSGVGLAISAHHSIIHLLRRKKGEGGGREVLLLWSDCDSGTDAVGWQMMAGDDKRFV